MQDRLKKDFLPLFSSQRVHAQDKEGRKEEDLKGKATQEDTNKIYTQCPGLLVSQHLFIRLRENRDRKDFERLLNLPWQGKINASHPSSIFQHKITTCNLLFLFQDRVSPLHICDCIHVILKKLCEHSEDTYIDAAGRRHYLPTEGFRKMDSFPEKWEFLQARKVVRF